MKKSKKILVSSLMSFLFLASFLLVSVEAATAPATKNGFTTKTYKTDFVWHSENYYGTIYRGYLPYYNSYAGKYNYKGTLYREGLPYPIY